MASRKTLLAFLERPDFFDVLRASLATPPRGSAAREFDAQHTRHAATVRRALDEAAARRPPVPVAEYAASPIDDAFFVDLEGKRVRDADYCFVQILGPEGPYFSNDVRVGVSFQGGALSYLGHHHEAQELYHVLSGPVEWRTGRCPVWERRDSSFHVSNEVHEMRTLGDALFFWSWTAGGKAGAETIELDVKHSSKDAIGARAGGVKEEEEEGGEEDEGGEDVLAHDGLAVAAKL